MKHAIAAAIAAGALCTPAFAEVSIGVDTSIAESALALACSGAPVDEAAVRASPLAQAQVAHNTRLRAAATMDAYVAALRALSACAAPDPDPFNVAAILHDPEAFRQKVALIAERRDQLAATVAERLRPYVPANFDFRGDVVLAVPYFSCGGFAQDERFFVDVRCLDDDIASDLEALALLIAHETYHAVQAQTFHPMDDVRGLNGRQAALASLFSELLIEGSASFVAPAETLPARGGRYTRLSRRFAADNAARMEANFSLMTILVEHVARAADPAAAAREGAEIAFSGGTFEEMGYFVGARMARDVEQAWGAPALVCVMQLPPEQFTLAHAAAVSGDADALRLGAPALEAARAVARRRGGAGYESCRR